MNKIIGDISSGDLSFRVLPEYTNPTFCQKNSENRIKVKSLCTLILELMAYICYERDSKPNLT